MRIAGIESTDLFLGTSQRPQQVIRVSVVNENPAVPSAAVLVSGSGVRYPEAVRVDGLPAGDVRVVEVPVEFAAPFVTGSVRRVTVEVPGDRQEADVTVAEPGWTMWMVSHFHYDPVWWNTQGQFTEARLVMPDEEGRLPDVRSAFELVQVHLAKALADPDYKFVLAEIDYLKPYFDTHPADRAVLRELMAQGRAEIVGGNYNEPNTNLISTESMIRNAVYGIGYQRDVAGGDPRTAWMLDVFGHDPGYPGLMAAAGLTSSAWARGPFHQWGPSGADGGGVGRMQFGSEFEWLSPDGSGLLTHYMAHHYGAGWRLHTPPDLTSAEEEAYGQFRGLSRVATTRNVLLPVGSDHVIPARWVTDIHRSWSQRYVWPRFVTALPSEFFAAVRSGVTSDMGAWITPQTRDMNPVYTGKDVSFIDTKQGQHAIEIAVEEAERLATLAALRGAPYPHASLDKVWRLLAYGAHHDGITGVESDQVYLDLVGSWREAWDRAAAARRDAAAYLGGSSVSLAAPGGIAVANGLARPRDGLARVRVTPPAGAAWLELRDPAGEPVPALAEGVVRREDGSLAEVTLTFTARAMPALGARGYQVAPVAASASTAAWAPVDDVETAVENDAYRVTADPSHGGTVRILDKRTGQDVLRSPGNELVLQDEYAQHPKHGEGPWHLSPRAVAAASGAVPAAVTVQRSPIGSRLVATYSLGETRVTQETVLLDGLSRVLFRTHVDGYAGKDRLLRVRFPADVPGGLPVYQTATAVVGRSFGCVDVDSAEHWYTLDNPARGWFGLGSTARVQVGDVCAAVGVAEVVCPDDGDELREPLRELMIALARAGVTATCSAADGPRYGAIDADSNLPDVRIVVGGPDLNAFSSVILGPAGPEYAKSLAAQLRTSGTGRVWVPASSPRAAVFAASADVRGARDLPALIVAGTGPAELALEVAELIADLADAVIHVPPADSASSGVTEPLADRSVALLNRGTPGSVVTPDGTLYLSLMRSCSAWPTGIWIDGERRTTPDDSAFALQHWSHTFEYALVSGAGDWREADWSAAAEDYAHDLVAVTGTPVTDEGTLGPLVSVEPANVTLSALKPHGNPLAAGRSASGVSGVTVRLRETEGRAGTVARVWLADGIVSAARTSLLEDTPGDPVPVEDGAALVDIPPFGTVTLVAQVGLTSENAAQPPSPALLTPDRLPEPVQPVYARYWLHGKGPAPAGNLPVAVHFTETRVAVSADEPSALLRVTVGAGPVPVAGQVELLVPAGLSVRPEGPLRYDIAAGSHAEWELTVAAPGAAPGRYFVTARITDQYGQLIEDAAMVAVGEKYWPDRALPPEEAMERMLADYAASAAEVELAALTPSVSVAPGGTAEIAVRITSHLASELRGEAMLISPFGSWDLLSPAAQPVAVEPGMSTALGFDVATPGTARPGEQWWALVKLAYFGRVWYSASIPVTITA